MNNYYRKGAKRPHGCRRLRPERIRQDFLPTGEPIVRPKILKWNWMYAPSDDTYKKALRDLKPDPETKWKFRRLLIRGMTVSQFFNHLELWYAQKVERQNNFYVYLATEDGIIKFNPAQRFSKKYANKVMYRIWGIRDVPLYSFWSLTVPAIPATGRAVRFHDQFRSVPRRWQNFRAYAKSNNIEFDYMRTFELQENGMMHIHFGCYTQLLNTQITKLSDYWARNNGHVKVKVYAGNYTYTSWVIGKKIVRWDQEEFEGNASHVITSYIWKYMLKSPSDLHKAILSWFHVRTYSVSKNLKKYLRAWETRADTVFLKSGYEEAE